MNEPGGVWWPRRPPAWPGIVGLLSACVLCGCSLTYLETSRQLGADESLLGASLTFGPMQPLPRFGLHATHGLNGAGDVSLFAGTGFTSFNVGAGSRAYVGEYLNVGMQAEAGWGPSDAEEAFGNRVSSGVFAIAPRAVTTTNEERFGYAGVQGWIPLASWGSGPWAESLDPVLLGLILGTETLTSDRGWRLQAEMAFWPVAWSAHRPVDDALLRMNVTRRGTLAPVFMVHLGLHADPGEIRKRFGRGPAQ